MNIVLSVLVLSFGVVALVFFVFEIYCSWPRKCSNCGSSLYYLGKTFRCEKCGSAHVVSR